MPWVGMIFSIFRCNIFEVSSILSFQSHIKIGIKSIGGMPETPSQETKSSTYKVPSVQSLNMQIEYTPWN